MRYFLFLFILSLFVKVHDFISCKDNDNQNVDWFIIYKIPKLKDHSEGILRDGYAFMYQDVNTPKWKYLGKSIADHDNALALTMHQLYQNGYSKQFMFLSYNDKSPAGKEHFDRGHTKGVVMANRTQGLWLVHSLPEFPHIIGSASDYVYPSNGPYNGQIFFCFNYGYDQLINISQLIYYNTPYFHDKNIPEDFKIGNEYLRMLDENRDDHTNKSEPWIIDRQIKTLGGLSLTGFAKYKKYDADIYTKRLAHFYETNLLSETWQTDHKHILNSSCKDVPHVENIKHITFSQHKTGYGLYMIEKLINNQIETNELLWLTPNVNDDISFSELIDHSKWAITNPTHSNYNKVSHLLSNEIVTKSVPESPYVVCIGDLNREETQAKRSGGMVCFEHKDVWQSFRSIVAEIESCPLNFKQGESFYMALN